MSKSIEEVVIERALEILEKGWCREAYAEDVDGWPVSPYSKQAVAFCAEGAIKRATQEMLGPGRSRIAARIIRQIDHMCAIENKEALLVINDDEGQVAAMGVMRDWLGRL